MRGWAKPECWDRDGILGNGFSLSGSPPVTSTEPPLISPSLLLTSRNPKRSSLFWRARGGQGSLLRSPTQLLITKHLWLPAAVWCLSLPGYLLAQSRLCSQAKQEGKADPSHTGMCTRGLCVSAHGLGLCQGRSPSVPVPVKCALRGGAGEVSVAQRRALAQSFPEFSRSLAKLLR